MSESATPLDHIHYRYVTPDEWEHRLCGYRTATDDAPGVELFLRGRFGDITSMVLPLDEARALAHWLLIQAGDQGESREAGHIKADVGPLSIIVDPTMPPNTIRVGDVEIVNIGDPAEDVQSTP